MQCPICKLSTGFYYWQNVIPGGPDQRLDYSLYQRSYVVGPRKGLITCQIMEEGEKPISPRCFRCYDKAVKEKSNG